RAELEDIRRRRVVARLVYAAALEQLALVVILGERLLERIGERELAYLRRLLANLCVVFVRGARELITAGVTAAAGRDRERHAQQLRVVDGVIHERPRLAEVERDLFVARAARDVEVRLGGAVTVRRAAALLLE